MNNDLPVPTGSLVEKISLLALSITQNRVWTITLISGPKGDVIPLIPGTCHKKRIKEAKQMQGYAAFIPMQPYPLYHALSTYIHLILFGFES